MPDLFGLTGTDAVVAWLVAGALVVGMVAIVLMLAALLSETKKTRLSVEYMRWVADGGPEREALEQQQQRQQQSEAQGRQQAPTTPAAQQAPAPSQGPQRPAAQQSFHP